MRNFYCCRFFVAAVTLLYSHISFSQTGLCPSNLDFETGTFLGWEGRTGQATNSLPLPNIGIVPGRHTIISRAVSIGQTDPYGGFPIVSPNGSDFSIQLGNAGTGNQAESISYTYTIPSTLTVFSMLFHYAVVLQNPNHGSHEQPRFRAKITDVLTNQPIVCVDFDFISGNSTGGFFPSPISPTVLYKDWTPISINLNEYIGRTIRLEFITSDCTLGGHFGYAYVDVNTNCNGAIEGNYLCAGAEESNLIAPYGFQSYQWFSDNTFTQLLATTQILNLNPPPSVGTIFPVIVGPFPGFGCTDTLYATIDIAPIPPANAGPDRLICGGGQASIGGPPVIGHTYSWSPTIGLSNPNIANPISAPSANTQYIVTTTDILTGCSAKDTVDVIIDAKPPAIFSIANNPGQCFSSNNFSFTHTNPSANSYVWHFGDGTTSTATSPQHSYTLPGTYTVKLVASTSIGCSDSTTQNVTVFAMPGGAISADSLYVCEGYPTLITATGGSKYSWYKNGVLLPLDSNAVLYAVDPGIYTAEVISPDGCRSAASNSVTMGLVSKPSADFSFDKFCIDIPINFSNHSLVSNSLPVDYLWNFGGGNTSTVVNPVFIFDSAGNKPVILNVTPQACSQLTSTFQIIIPVEKPRPAISYYPLNAVENKPTQLVARNFGHNYLWSPTTYLSNPVSVAPVFNGVGEHILTVAIMRNSGCVTVDTQLVRIFKEADIIVPKAFTPNGDGRNDRLYPFLVGINKLKYFRVINRWGKVVFESNTDIPGWDGTIHGKPQPIDGYVWEAEGVDAYGNIIRRKGTVTLIR